MGLNLFLLPQVAWWHNEQHILPLSTMHNLRDIYRQIWGNMVPSMLFTSLSPFFPCHAAMGYMFFGDKAWHPANAGAIITRGRVTSVLFLDFPPPRPSKEVV